MSEGGRERERERREREGGGREGEEGQSYSRAKGATAFGMSIQLGNNHRSNIHLLLEGPGL